VWNRSNLFGRGCSTSNFGIPTGRKQGERHIVVCIFAAQPYFAHRGVEGYVFFVFVCYFCFPVSFLGLCGFSCPLWFLSFFLGRVSCFFGFCVSWQYAATIAQQQVKHQLKEQKDNDNVL